MKDPYERHTPGLTSPALFAAEITPNDEAVLTRATRAVYIGEPGNMRVRMISGDIVTFRNIQEGTYYPIRVAQIMATGTSAASIIGLS